MIEDRRLDLGGRPVWAAPGAGQAVEQPIDA
jgi:hypothetical protein